MVTEKINPVDYSTVKDRVVMKVVNAKAEKDLLQDRPHTLVKDLAVLYDIEMFRTDNQRVSIPVTNEMLKAWEISLEELHSNALESTARKNPYVLTNMSDIIFGGAVNFLDGADYVNDGMLLVATNEEKMFGANIIADDKMLGRIAEIIKDDMYILPSSIHELLICPKENVKGLGLTPKGLGKMVRDVNRSEVAPADRLADHIYEYNRDTKELAIVNASREKAMER